MLPNITKGKIMKNWITDIIGCAGLFGSFYILMFMEWAVQ